MKYILATLFLFAILLNTQAQLPSTRLWRISGNGLNQPSYLFGSMHVYDERAFNFSDSVLYALKSCEQFSNEVSPDSLVSYVYNSVSDRFQSQLENVFFEDDEDEDEALQELSLNTGFDKTLLKKINPVVLRQLVPTVRKSSKNKPVILDFYLYNIARNEGKRCIGIEKIGNQVNLFKHLNDSVQSEYVRYSIGKKRSFRNEQQIDLYADANLNALYDQLQTMPPNLFKVMFTDRNILMALAIDSISKQASTFYTVGIGHLPGDDGLIALLKQKGYNVDPVKETFTGAANRISLNNTSCNWHTFRDEKNGYSVDFPLPGYTLPNLPSNITFALCYDLGSSIFYTNIARQAAFFNAETNVDSIINEFVVTGWKTKIPNEKITHIQYQGIQFSECRDLQLGNFKAFIRGGVSGNTLILLMAIADKNNSDLSIQEFLNSYRPIEKLPDNWELFTSEKGGYQVKFPGKPHEISFDKSKQAEAMILNMINGIDNNTGSEYLIQYLDFPGKYFENDSLIINTTITEMQNAGTGKVMEDSAFMIQGFPARKCIIEIKTGQKFQIFVILKGSRLYVILGEKKNPNMENPETEAFFNSFKFTPIDWNKWEMQNDRYNHFSMIAPSALIRETIYDYTNKYDSIVWYNSIDPFSGEQVSAIEYEFSPFFRISGTDSAFFAGYYSTDASEGDSVIKQLVLQSNPIIYFYETENTGSHLVTQRYYCTHGRILYKFFTHIPKPYSNEHPWKSEKIPFSFLTSAQPGNLHDNKTIELLASLNSGDSIKNKAASNALNFYEFNPDEMPLVWNALYKPMFDDTAAYSSSRVELMRSVQKYLDSLYADLMIRAFDTVFPTPVSQVKALGILSEKHDFSRLDFIKAKFLQVPPDSIMAFSFLYTIADSADYVAAFYPEILNFLKDSINRDYIIDITLTLLENAKIKPDLLIPYRDVIFAIMKECAGNTDENGPGFLMSKIFRIGGYLKDKEINDFLLKNQGNKDRYTCFNILTSLIDNGIEIKTKNAANLAQNTEMRHDFYNYLTKKGKLDLIPSVYKTQEAIAESDLFNYLLYEDYTPEKLKNLGMRDLMVAGEMQRYFLFEIAYEDTEDEGVEFVIAGPYPLDGSILDESPSSIGVYWSNDSTLTPEQHFKEAEKALNSNQD